MNGTEPSVLLEQILTPEARERLARIKLEHPELTERIEKQLVALALKWRGERPGGGNRGAGREREAPRFSPFAPLLGGPAPDGSPRAPKRYRGIWRNTR